MKKRIFSLFLALALLCTLLPQVALPASAETYSGTCGAEGDGSNLTWTLDTETGVLTIEGSGAMKDYDIWSSVPWYDYRTIINSITIVKGLTNIGVAAFNGCNALTDVTIPDSVTSIGRSSFDSCKLLTSVEIPDSVTIIDDSAFTRCDALTSATIPGSVTRIGCYAFGWCKSLQNIIISNGVTRIDEGAFFNCNALTSVSIPDSVTSIGNGAFRVCSSLTNVTIPNSVTRIASATFEGCISLTNVILPNSVTSIGREAFYDCSTLTSVTIPASVTDIDYNAFGWYWNEEIGAHERVDGFTIYGYYGTAAQSYAEENDFRFVSLGGFKDVSQSDYFFNPVLWATGCNPPITAGVGEGQFGPHNDCTREQIVTFLWAANGKPEPAGTGEAFSDVSADAWYYKPVMWAVENKITSGIGDGLFGVGNTCTRAQAVTFLYAAAGKPEFEMPDGSFSDVAEGDWFYNPVMWAVTNNVTSGIGDGKFGPSNTCTRAQIVTFLWASEGRP